MFKTNSALVSERNKVNLNFISIIKIIQYFIKFYIPKTFLQFSIIQQVRFSFRGVLSNEKVLHNKYSYDSQRIEFNIQGIFMRCKQKE